MELKDKIGGEAKKNIKLMYKDLFVDELDNNIRAEIELAKGGLNNSLDELQNEFKKGTNKITMQMNEYHKNTTKISKDIIEIIEIENKDLNKKIEIITNIIGEKQEEYIKKIFDHSGIVEKRINETNNMIVQINQETNLNIENIGKNIANTEKLYNDKIEVLISIYENDKTDMTKQVDKNNKKMILLNVVGIIILALQVFNLVK